MFFEMTMMQRIGFKVLHNKVIQSLLMSMKSNHQLLVVLCFNFNKNLKQITD